MEKRICLQKKTNISERTGERWQAFFKWSINQHLIFFPKINTGYLYNPSRDGKKGIGAIQRIFVFCVTARGSLSRCKRHAFHICEWEGLLNRKVALLVAKKMLCFFYLCINMNTAVTIIIRITLTNLTSTNKEGALFYAQNLRICAFVLAFEIQVAGVFSAIVEWEQGIRCQKPLSEADTVCCQPFNSSGGWKASSTCLCIPHSWVMREFTRQERLPLLWGPPLVNLVPF